MPQVFQVLCCYSCDMFQVHQVKKSNKWECKVCHEKQSLKKAFKIGSAPDCRSLVQELNMQRGVSNLAKNSDNWQEEDDSLTSEGCTGSLSESFETDKSKSQDFYRNEHTRKKSFEISEQYLNDTHLIESKEVGEVSDTLPDINHQDKVKKLLPEKNSEQMIADEFDTENRFMDISEFKLNSKPAVNENIKNLEKHQKCILEYNSHELCQLKTNPVLKKHCGFQKIMEAASKLS